MAIPGDSVTIGSTIHVARPRCGYKWDSFFCLTCATSFSSLEELEHHLGLEGGHVIGGQCELHGLECRRSQ